VCRWLVYSGSPILLDELPYEKKHSLIVQSLHSAPGAETTNGDGLGVGWYGAQATPGVFHGTERPGMAATCVSWRCMWSRRWSSRTSAPRAAPRSSRRTVTCSGTGAGCGCTTGSSGASRRSSVISPSQLILPCRPRSRGPRIPSCSIWHLRSGGGRPTPGRRARGRPGRSAQQAARSGAPHPDDGRDVRLRAPVGVPVLERGPLQLAVHSTDVRTLRHQYPDNPVPHAVSDGTRLVVFEPLGVLKGAWREVPEASCAVVSEGRHGLKPFTPRRAELVRGGPA
jgi:hypothetical protein